MNYNEKVDYDKYNGKVKGKDVMTFYGYTKNQACRRIRDAKANLNKKRHQDLTVKQFCEYYGVMFTEFVDKVFLKDK